MKFASLLGFLVFNSLSLAHEGHDHQGGGAGTVVTTAVETGSGDHRYVTIPGWGAMPDGKNIGNFHGDSALDKEGNVYVSTVGEPGIVKFDQFGKFVSKLKGGLTGMHSLTSAEENGQTFLYGSQLPKKRVVKCDLEGTIVATFPNEKTGELEGGSGGLTETLVAPNGDIYLFMGYGSKKIHRLKSDGTLIKTYGGAGTGKDQFSSCHGAAFDLRYEEPRILVCDREGRRMIHLTMDLTWIGIYGKTGMRRPADVDVQGDYAAIAEHEGRVILMNKAGETVSILCDNADEKQWANNGVPANELHDRTFTAPHGIQFGPLGQIYCTEYSKVGRIIALYPLK